MFSDEFKTKFAKWQEMDKSLVRDLFCCGFCGVTAFGGECQSLAGFKSVKPMGSPEPLPFPPYGACNMPMLDYMMTTDNAGQQLWRQCGLCSAKNGANRDGRMKHLGMMTQEYQEKLLACHPLDAQKLSLIDVSLTVTNRVCGHAHGVLKSKTAPLDSPLIAR